MTQPVLPTQRSDSAIHTGFGDLAAALRQLHGALRRPDTEGEASIAEPQIANQLLKASSRLEPIEEYRKAEEELLSPAFLSLIDVIASIGELAGRRHAHYTPEYLRKVARSLGNVEECGAYVLKVILAESPAGKDQQEQLKGVLRNLVETIQEKKLFIVRQGETISHPS